MSEKEDSYVCKKCGEVERLKDWDWKERHFYYVLRNEGLCEQCARGMK